MDKFRNKYRIPSARLPGWDYGSNGTYFVTICTKDMKCYFGSVKDGTMILSELGKYAEQCWKDIPNHFPFVKLGAFVVMPNHVHGIIVIDKKLSGNGDGMVETQNIASVRMEGDSDEKMEDTQDIASVRLGGRNGGKFGQQSGNLASIVRGFKVGVSKYARVQDVGFEWQARFHDHIVRDGESFYRITKYIQENPANWPEDRYCLLE